MWRTTNIYERLGEITTTPLSYIPITVDSDYWQFNPDWKPKDPSINRDKGTVLMVANRIESKKGILPVAIACADLGLKFVLVGAVSNADYMQSILATGGNVEFHEQIPDEELRQLYYKSTLLVCNSVDNFESGTMPILEAMFCGVPVLTRKVGHVPDLYNGENMVIHEGTSEDVLDLKDLIYETIGDEKKLFSLRDKAWQTVKSRNFERRAYSYQKLYRDVLYPDQIPVSIVVPINDKPEIIRKCINALSEQTYKNIELVVADDHYRSYTELSDGEKIYHSNKELVQDFAKYVEFPVRYINSSQGDYGLARARNIGTIEATGDIIVYCDQR